MYTCNCSGMEVETGESEAQGGTGEMAQWFRAFAALAEDLCSVPSTHMVVHNCP